MTSFGDLGILVAGPTSGVIAARAGAPTAFTAAALAGLAAVAVVVVVACRTRRGEAAGTEET